MNPDTFIVGGTDETRAELYAGFANSSEQWARKSVEAARRGDFEKARTFALVARVADSVARGGLS